MLEEDNQEDSDESLSDIIYNSDGSDGMTWEKPNVYE